MNNAWIEEVAKRVEVEVRRVAEQVAAAVRRIPQPVRDFMEIVAREAMRSIIAHFNAKKWSVN